MGLINSKQIEQPVNFSGSFSGSFNGNATSASYAVTASYAMSVSEEGNSVTSINTITGSVTFSAGSNVILNQSGSNIEINANFTQEGKYLIAGGVSWSGTGLSYDVSTLEYFFNGNKTSEPTTVTLDASDPYNNRFDAIVVDELGVVSVVKGNASSSPEVPTIQDNQLQVSIILVEAATTAPTILSESIYLDNPTSGWTFSTYDTGGTGTGTINFTGTNLPKQGINCIESNTGARRGARFVRNTSFDAFQYTIMSLWVRFTGTSVATNKSLNVRFENSAGSLVGNNINLFSFGLQRNILNTWQLVVIPITSFGSLPSTVKGLKIIMSGGTVGQTRQWDLDYILLTNSSVPYANVPTITFAKDDIAIGTAAGVNIKQGEGIAITSSINPTTGYAEYIFNNISSSYAQTASYAISSSYAQTSSYSLSSLYAQTASYSLSSSYAISSSYVQTASYAENSQTASYVILAQTASYVKNAQTASYVVNSISSSYALTASYALNPLIPTQVSQLINDSGYITSSALAPYLTTASAAATYQPILVSGTTIKTINGTSLLGSGDITISASALSSITAATSSNIIHNGNFTQEWTWNSISNQSGLKLSSTANGITSNTKQKLFESVLTGRMVDTSNASYAGYFDNQQTVGGAYGIYARGYIAAQLEGFVNINGALDINNLRIWNNSGVTYLTPSSNQSIVIGQAGPKVQFQLNGQAIAFALSTKVSGTSYVYGLGCGFQSGAYLSEKTTAALFERNSDKLMFSSNSGLSGNYNTFTPTFQLTISGATNNIGIGTTSPNASAKLDVSSTTQGFAPPEMTATQASAISTTSRKLIIYVTDTNGTFTSAGLWMWNGTIWKLILAE